RPQEPTEGTASDDQQQDERHPDSSRDLRGRQVEQTDSGDQSSETQVGSHGQRQESSQTGDSNNPESPLPPADFAISGHVQFVSRPEFEIPDLNAHDTQAVAESGPQTEEQKKGPAKEVAKETNKFGSTVLDTAEREALKEADSPYRPI